MQKNENIIAIYSRKSKFTGKGEKGALIFTVRAPFVKGTSAQVRAAILLAICAIRATICRARSAATNAPYSVRLAQIAEAILSASLMQRFLY